MAYPGDNPDLRREEGQSNEAYANELKHLFRVLTEQANRLRSEKMMPARMIENRLQSIDAQLWDIHQTKLEIQSILLSLSKCKK